MENCSKLVRDAENAKEQRNIHKYLNESRFRNASTNKEETVNTSVTLPEGISRQIFKYDSR